MSTIKSNLKFVIHSNRGTKLATKTIGKEASDYASTISINTNNNKAKEKFVSRKIIDLRTKSNLNDSGQGTNTNPTISLSTINVASPNPSKQIEKEQKELQTITKDKYKDTYNSNNSNKSMRIKDEKVSRPKHMKHASEIPMCFKTNPQYSTSDNNFFYDQTKNNFIINMYSPTDKEIPREPKMTKLNSQRGFESSNRSRGISKHSFIQLSQGNKENSTNSIPRKRTNSNTNDHNITEENHRIKENDFKYKSLLLKCKDQEKSIKEYLRTIEILKSYINSSNNALNGIKTGISGQMSKKDYELIKLKEENAAIKKNNKELKLNLLKVIYGIKLYEMNEITRESNFDVNFYLY